MVKPEIKGNVNFEIKSQFMRELGEDTFSENKNEDAHEHIKRIISIVSLFNVPRVSQDVELSTPGNSSRKPLYKGMTPVQALTAIQTMDDHSQKWHDETSSKSIGSSNNTNGLAAIVRVEEVKYSEFGIPAPFNGSNGAKFCIGSLGYCTRINNRPPYEEKRPSLEELINKHQEESVRSSAEMEEWVKKL
ncbi:hypothetical protein Tco_0367605 [Tanacetum coccineum]